ncbi:hypothetical protein Bca101_053746 [Brassica carinata]
MEIGGSRSQRFLVRRGGINEHGVEPGVTTDDIDEAIQNMIIENGAYPSPLGYGGFAKSVCTSVNECICPEEDKEDI